MPRAKRRIRHLTLAVVAALLSGCAGWQPRVGVASEILADPEVRHVRLTQQNNERVEVRIAEVRGDTIYGTPGGSGPISCESASPTCAVRMPISRVGFVEERRLNVMRTAALAAAPVVLVGLIFLVPGRSCTTSTC